MEVCHTRGALPPPTSFSISARTTVMTLPLAMQPCTLHVYGCEEVFETMQFLVGLRTIPILAEGVVMKGGDFGLRAVSIYIRCRRAALVSLHAWPKIVEVHRVIAAEVCIVSCCCDCYEVQRSISKAERAGLSKQTCNPPAPRGRSRLCSADRFLFTVFIRTPTSAPRSSGLCATHDGTPPTSRPPPWTVGCFGGLLPGQCHVSRGKRPQALAYSHHACRTCESPSAPLFARRNNQLGLCFV